MSTADRVLPPVPAEVHHLGTVVFLSLSMCFTAHSLIGLFLRYLAKPSRRWRYMADASYWIYIVHAPFVIMLPLVFVRIPLPGIVKLALVVTMATGLIRAMYHYFVRPTFIGKQLNGRRYPHASWGGPCRSPSASASCWPDRVVRDLNGQRRRVAGGPVAPHGRSERLGWFRI